MTDLNYRSFVLVDDLQVGECTIHAASDGARRWWQLWFYVARETDGVPEAFVVPVFPNGSYHEDGAGGRTWGFTAAGQGLWQVSPSINVVQDGDAKAIHAGQHPTLPSLWHQTPRVVGVPDGERWIAGAP